jgi:hypothetical protein
MDQKILLKEFIKLFNNNDKIIIKKIMNENYDNEDYWKFIFESLEINDEFIQTNYNEINIKYLIKYQYLSESLLIWLDKQNNINDYYEDLIKYQILPNNLLEKYLQNTLLEKIDFYNLALNQNLTDEILEKYKDHLDWNIISQEQLLKLQTILKYKDKINWSLLPLNIKTQYLFNDSFVLIFQKENIWDNIGWMDQVTQKCLWEYKNLISNKGWLSIIEHKELEEDKLNEFINDIFPNLNIKESEIWNIICTNQKLSEEFMEKYEDKIDWHCISLFQELSWEFIKKYSKNINLDNLSNNDCYNDKLKKLIEENKEIF